MTWKSKLLIGIGVVALIIGLLLVIKWQRDLLNKQEEINASLVEMKHLQDGIVRAQAQYATKKDLEQFAKDHDVDLGPIKNDLKKLDAEIKGISVVLAKTPGTVLVNLPSTGSEPRPDKPPPLTAECPGGEVVNCPNPDKYNYLSNAQKLELNEPLSDKTQVPWGNVKFSAWREKPWDLTVHPREYSVVTVLSTNEDGRHFVHNKFMIDVDGKKYAMPITEAKFVEQYPESKFRWSPGLTLGLSAGTYLSRPEFEASPSLQLFLFSYGKTKVQPTWMFLGLGPAYNINQQNFAGMLTPVMYNVGEHLPLVNNVYLGPSVSLSASGDFALLGGLHVGL